MSRSRAITFGALALLACCNSESSAPVRPPGAPPHEPTPSEFLSEEETRRTDPVCINGGLLQTECIEKYGPEFGENAWGTLDNFHRNVFIDAGDPDKLDCFRSFGEAGESAYVPPLSAKCHLGPKNMCVPVASEAERDEPWEFVPPDPDSGAPWTKIFEWDRGRAGGTHVRFGWSSADNDCEIWVEGLADLDGDGVFSTYVQGDRIGDKKKTRRVDTPEDPELREEAP